MKDPAMLFYTSDFLTGVTFLSMKERGQYITLLCLQQQLGHMSRKQMETAVGKISPGLMEKFTEDEDGLLYNRRAEIEIQKREAHSRKQREAVMQRWIKTVDPVTKEEIPKVYDGTNSGNTVVLPLENGNGNIQVKSSSQGKTERKEEEFNKFWEAYPRKIGKQAARKAFDKLPASVYPKLVPAVEAQKNGQQWKREDGRYIPNPATWLNQGRWDDEVQAYQPVKEAKMIGGGFTGEVDMEGLEKFLESMGGDV